MGLWDAEVLLPVLSHSVRCGVAYGRGGSPGVSNADGRRDSVSEYAGTSLYPHGGSDQDGGIYGDAAGSHGSGAQDRAAYYREAGGTLRSAAPVLCFQYVLHAVYGTDFSHKGDAAFAGGESGASDRAEHLFLCAGGRDIREPQAGERTQSLPRPGPDAASVLRTGGGEVRGLPEADSRHPKSYSGHGSAVRQGICRRAGQWRGPGRRQWCCRWRGPDRHPWGGKIRRGHPPDAEQFSAEILHLGKAAEHHLKR